MTDLTKFAIGIFIFLAIGIAFICNDRKMMEKDDTIAQVDSLHSKEIELKKKTDSTDIVLDNGLEKEDKIVAPLRKEFKNEIREVRKDYEALPISNDTIQLLVKLIEKADSIIDVNSVEILMQHEKYLNQKAFADSLLVINSKLDGDARKEAKRAALLTKMVQRRNFWIKVTSAIAAISLGVAVLK